jgi:hypothetical protein
MQPVLEKRSSESAVYDIDCSDLLATGESITGTVTMSVAPATTPALAFGAATVNASPKTYTDRETGAVRTVPAGQVISVSISGGKIPAGLTVQRYTVRAVFATNVNAAVEATVLLDVNDTPRA